MSVYCRRNEELIDNYTAIVDIMNDVYEAWIVAVEHYDLDLEEALNDRWETLRGARDVLYRHIEEDFYRYM